LGNPGARYERTRHNAGFRVVEELAREARAQEWSRRCRSLVCRATIGGEPVVLAKPLTYMNLSGEAVRLLLTGFGADPKEMILILDDLNLPMGRIRVRERGSSGGQLGLESVLRTLGGEEIIRVRLGVGEQEMPGDKAGFVLSELPPEKDAGLHEMVVRAAQAVRMIITDGVSKAMSVFNA
jgi:PTH1 family peptidyl-tRNA hydrolase